MGWSAARKLRRAVDGLARVLAIEILTAARAVDMREIPGSPVTQAVLTTVRERVPAAGPDRFLAPDIAAAVQLVLDGTLLAAALGEPNTGR